MVEERDDRLASYSTGTWQGYPVLEVSGEIDISNYQVFDDALAAFSSATHLVIDFSRLAFIDSTGLGALAKHAKRVTSGGGRIRLIVKTSAVQRVLSVSGLASYFVIAESLEGLD